MAGPFFREPTATSPAEVESLPDRPAVFLLWAGVGQPYLARTSALRRRLKRLLNHPERLSKLVNLAGLVDRIEYWLTGSQIDATLIHLELAQRYFPEDWQRITRLRPPVFVRLTTANAFPRTMITTRLGRGVYYGPFSGRVAAETFQAGVLDLFQLRRCDENLAPSAEHPGCIYGEMNRCLRPCQQAVSLHEYASEAARVAQFFETDGASLHDSAGLARDRASKEMQFEEAERLHARVERIEQVRALSGELARAVDRLAGIAVTPIKNVEAVDLWFMIHGQWQRPRRLPLNESEGAGRSLDHRLRDITQSVQADLEPGAAPNLDHLSILVRWHSSNWREGEWLAMDWPAKIPYRKLVNAVGRVVQQIKTEA